MHFWTNQLSLPLQPFLFPQESTRGTDRESLSILFRGLYFEALPYTLRPYLSL